MQTYKTFQPTKFDSKGLAADRLNIGEWLVLPCGRNRDSSLMEESNFDTALKMLGGESDNVEIHRFGHWACGWFEIIIVRPDTPQAAIAHQIESKLED